MTETERLIELVKERSFLYDLNDSDNKNRQKKLQAWRDIADEMGGGDPHTWSSKWKGLKDNYAKYKKTNDPIFGPAYKKYKHWPWAEYMKFLDNYNSFGNRRITGQYTSNSDLPQEDQSFNIQLFIPDPQLHSTTDEVHDPLPMSSENITSDIKKRKLNTKFEEELLELPHKLKRNEPISKFDGVDHFFLSYAQSFKKLPSRMQIMLKLEIATLFSRYELQAEGVTSESISNISRIVPHPIKSEYDFTNTIDDDE